MAWDHLDIDKPHLAYMIIGGFTCLFMLCSLFVKEKLYIGEATVATLCGVIFGPHAADLFNPATWGNVDKITLECSRIVLVVQCFAVGVELPKSYMERHWRSVIMLLLPVMTWGWLITSLFIWWMVEPLTWIESLACSACVTATDPVLASSVVGKGKFSKRVPKHLRDLLSAESGCNDGMAFPFIYLSVYIIAYMGQPDQVALHWFCVTILYECVVGALFGFLVGYGSRHAIKFAEKKGLVDRESFLAFYFVLALFCAGAGSLLGLDDLLVGFAAGVGFSNDGWFTEQTEESHVSNVIDLLLNLSYFIFLGAVLPWTDFNMPEFGLIPWKLVVIAIMVIFFRRIPAMLILKPVIPDIKSWREALFAGHFGPIGVGAIFACILARAELETHSTQPLAILPHEGEHNYIIVKVIWPITAFIVISSIIVHGSSIAVFTLGKHINTLSITMSYTREPDEQASWLDRLPRIQSTGSKSSFSFRKDSLEGETPEQSPESSPESAGAINVPKDFLRAQRDSTTGQESEPGSRSSSRRPIRRKKMGPGGPISQSAIIPQRRSEPAEEGSPDISPPAEDARPDEDQVPEGQAREPELEVYREGHRMVIEDEEGNVLEDADVEGLSPEAQRDEIFQQHQRLHGDRSGSLSKSKTQPHERTEGEHVEEAVGRTLKHPYRNIKKYMSPLTGKKEGKETGPGTREDKSKKDRGRRSAHAFQFGDTVIVEDEDGEVIKKYTLPQGEQEQQRDVESQTVQQGARRQKPLLGRMGTWGFGKKGESAREGAEGGGEKLSDDNDLRFTVSGTGKKGQGDSGRRMNKEDFLREIQQKDKEGQAIYHPKALFRRDSRDKSSESGPQKEQNRQRHEEQGDREARGRNEGPEREETENAPISGISGSTGRKTNEEMSPTEAQHRRFSGVDELPLPSTSRKRRDSEDDGTERIPPALLRQQVGLPPSSSTKVKPADETGETPAERRRRLAALGVSGGDSEESPRDSRSSAGRSDDSEENGESRKNGKDKVQFSGGSKPHRTPEARESVSPLRLSGARSQPDAPGVSKDEQEENGGNTEPGTEDDSGNGNGNGNGRGRKRHISWGGERGRDP